MRLHVHRIASKTSSERTAPPVDFSAHQSWINRRSSASSPKRLPIENSSCTANGDARPPLEEGIAAADSVRSVDVFGDSGCLGSGSTRFMSM